MSNGRLYRVGIVGCGRIGADGGPTGSGSSRIASHAAAYTAFDRTELVAVCDADEHRAALAGARWNVDGRYTELGRMLDEEHLDFLSICTPPESHLEMLGIALAHGVRGVLLEKPLAADLASAESILSSVESGTMTVAVNYARRYPEVYRRAIADVRRGCIGRVQHVAVLYTKGILNNGSHALDLLRAFFGDPAWAEAVPGSGSGEADPTLTARIGFPDGFEAWLGGMDANAYNLFDVDIIGTEGRIVFTDLGHVMHRYATVDTRSEHGFRQLQAAPDVSPTGLITAVGDAVENLVRCTETGVDPACTPRDAYEAMAWSLRLADQVRGGVERVR